MEDRTGEAGAIEESALYFIESVTPTLINLFIDGTHKPPVNYIELAINYNYVENGEQMSSVMPPLCLDMDALIELSAIVGKCMVRLEDANPVEFVFRHPSLGNVTEEDAGSWPGDEEEWDNNAGEPLD